MGGFLRGGSGFTSLAELEALLSVDVTDAAELAAALAGKAAVSHTHAVADVADSGAAGRAVVQAATGSAIRSGINVGKMGTCADNPNAGAGTAGSIGDVLVDTTHSVRYMNMDGTATGWDAF